MNKLKFEPSLLFCFTMDLVGSSSFFFPGVGEWFDLLWAPLSAFIFYRTFSGNIAKIGSVVSFIEEILPFTDIIPTFTIGYIYNHFRNKTTNKNNETT